MGAWGLGAFDNDDAADWVHELDVAADEAVLERAFACVSTIGEPGSPDCCRALAAAEVVAALRGRPGSSLPEAAAAWVVGRDASAPLVDAARRAVDTVAARSELRELWAETEDLAAWLRLVDDLRGRLR
jgi:hypothetical protein